MLFRSPLAACDKGPGATISFNSSGEGGNAIVQADGDRIDLRTVGFTSLSQLVVTQAADANHYVVDGDTNADGVADFHLDVFGAAAAPNQDAFIFA